MRHKLFSSFSSFFFFLTFVCCWFEVNEGRLSISPHFFLSPHRFLFQQQEKELLFREKWEREKLEESVLWSVKSIPLIIFATVPGTRRRRIFFLHRGRGKKRLSLSRDDQVWKKIQGHFSGGKKERGPLFLLPRALQKQWERKSLLHLHFLHTHLLCFCFFSMDVSFSLSVSPFFPSPTFWPTLSFHLYRRRKKKVERKNLCVCLWECFLYGKKSSFFLTHSQLSWESVSVCNSNFLTWFIEASSLD